MKVIANYNEEDRMRSEYERYNQAQPKSRTGLLILIIAVIVLAFALALGGGR